MKKTILIVSKTTGVTLIYYLHLLLHLCMLLKCEESHFLPLFVLSRFPSLLFRLVKCMLPEFVIRFNYTFSFSLWGYILFFLEEVFVPLIQERTRGYADKVNTRPIYHAVSTKPTSPYFQPPT